MKYLLHNLAELAERRARNVREEAQLWDILSRDLKRAAKELDNQSSNRPTRTSQEAPEDLPVLEDRLYVRVNEAMKIMGISRGSIYKEIGEGRLPIRKAGKSTLIAVKDIHEWFENLEESVLKR
ncbi:MAG: helix-turn-helix domain-containing protein [Pseudobdellovibrionaceae bacterium]